MKPAQTMQTIISRKMAIAALALCLLAAACGDNGSSGDGKTEGSAGDQSALAALPETDRREAILDLVMSLYGPTENISNTVNKLAYFPEIGSTRGINVVAMNASPGSGDVGVEYKSSGTVDELVTYHKTDLKSRGWTIVDEPIYEGEMYARFEVKQLEFEREAESDRPEQLKFRFVDDTDLGFSFVGIDYSHFNSPAMNSLLKRFDGWDTNVPRPDGGSYSDSGVSSIRHGLRNSVVVWTRYDYPNGKTEAELQAETFGLAEAAGLNPTSNFLDQTSFFETSSLVEKDWEIKVNPMVVGDFTGVTTEASIDFAGASIAENKPQILNTNTAALPKNATAEEIYETLTSITGATDDVAAQMKRFGPFPLVPTPEVGEILSVSSELRRDATVQRVSFLNTGDAEALQTFYQSALVSEGWEVKRERSDSTDKFTNRRKLTFGFERQGTEELDVTILADPSEPTERRQVTLAYSVDGNPAADQLNRHAFWAGETPMPEGGTVLSSRLALEKPLFYTLGNQKYFVTYDVGLTYDYRMKDEIPTILESNISDSDYSATTPYESTLKGQTPLEHSYFDEASLRTTSNIVSFGALKSVE